MANNKKHRRKKSKRNVRCTICTSYRWLGNTKERRKMSDKKKLADAKEQLREIEEAA